MAKKLRCYLGRHRWQKKVVEGEIYYECRDCGNVRDPRQLPYICR
jgi:hypothetical protein